MDARQNALTHLLVCLLVLWAFTTAALLGIGPNASMETVLLGGILIGAVALMGFVVPDARLRLAGTAVATLYFVAAQVYRMLGEESVRIGMSRGSPLFATTPAAGSHLPVLAAGVVGLAVTWLLSDALARRLFRTEAQLARNATVIRELTIHDSTTGTLKANYADAQLTEEIERSRRYKHTLSLVLLGPDDWQAILRERGQNDSMEALRLAGEAIAEGLRSMDVVFYREQAQFAVILPETGVAGGCVAAERLSKAVTSRTAIMYRAGVAEFPGDAVSKAELINEAEAALRFARSASLNVASRVLLS